METREQAARSGDPLDHMGRSGSPSWSVFYRGNMVSPGAKDPVDTIDLPW